MLAWWLHQNIPVLFSCNCTIIYCSTTLLSFSVVTTEFYRVKLNTCVFSKVSTIIYRRTLFYLWSMSTHTIFKRSCGSLQPYFVDKPLQIPFHISRVGLMHCTFTAESTLIHNATCIIKPISTLNKRPLFGMGKFPKDRMAFNRCVSCSCTARVYILIWPARRGNGSNTATIYANQQH